MREIPERYRDSTRKLFSYLMFQTMIAYYFLGLLHGVITGLISARLCTYTVPYILTKLYHSTVKVTYHALWLSSDDITQCLPNVRHPHITDPTL